MTGVDHALFIIGEPGIGKSTLVAALTEGLPFEEAEKPFPIRRYDCGVVELGKRRADFPGTDALAMNAQPMVSQWLSDVHPHLLLLEGDRLANDKFITWLEILGYKVHLTLLMSAKIAEQRRRERGSKQDEKWLRGRRTKVYNLAQAYNATTLGADATPEMLVRRLVDPVATTLKEAAVPA